MDETESKLLGCKLERGKRKERVKQKKGRNKHKIYFDKVSEKLFIYLYLFIE